MNKFFLIVLLSNVVCSVAQENNYSIKKSAINSSYSDFGVAYYGENNIVFSSARKNLATKKKKWIRNNQAFLDFYKGDLNSVGEITNVVLFSKNMNSKFHKSNITFTKDLKTAYFTGNGILNKKLKQDNVALDLIQIYKATSNGNGKWDVIKVLPFVGNYQAGHPSLNEAEDKLYFISDMPGSYGATDIYVVDIKKDGSYGIPKNLGTNVNTAQKEMFPFISTDGVLYYSSDGFSDTYGGMDIYATKRNKDSLYYKSKNLGAPINSAKDDHSFIIDNYKKTGFFASNRKGGNGDDDIYSFVELNSLVFLSSVNNLEAGNGTENKSIVPSELGNEDNTVSSDTLLNKLEKSIADTTNSSKVSGTIYFNNTSSLLRKDTKIILNEVLFKMLMNKNLRIIFKAYSSAIGTSKFNMWLSNKRAKVVADYLILYGVSKEQIVWEAYGESQIVNKCLNGVKCADYEHKENRRVEFRIVNDLKSE